MSHERATDNVNSMFIEAFANLAIHNFENHDPQPANNNPTLSYSNSQLASIQTVEQLQALITPPDQDNSDDNPAPTSAEDVANDRNQQQPRGTHGGSYNLERSEGYRFYAEISFGLAGLSQPPITGHSDATSFAPYLHPYHACMWITSVVQVSKPCANRVLLALFNHRISRISTHDLVTRIYVALRHHGLIFLFPGFSRFLPPLWSIGPEGGELGRVVRSILAPSERGSVPHYDPRTR